MTLTRARWSDFFTTVHEFYFSSQARNSSTRERLTVISNEDSGVDVIRSLPFCLVMLFIAFIEIIHQREMRKKNSGFSSSLITSRDESMM